jgi:hypothetical protein
MKIFFDFEFIENGNEHPIIPVSIGMVREDNKEYYAEFSGVDWSKANDWVLENVKPYLGTDPREKFSREDIAVDIVDFVGEKPEFWGYYSDYDWVILCQLYGKMIDLPTGWPMFCLDIRQYLYHLDKTIEDVVVDINPKEHDALEDARWNKRVFDWLVIND